MPSVMELHGDLVEEERVNTALAQKLAGDLDKEYPSILAELTCSLNALLQYRTLR